MKGVLKMEKYGKKDYRSDNELVADMLTSSDCEIVVGPDGTIMPKHDAHRKNIEGTKLLKQRVWGCVTDLPPGPAKTGKMLLAVVVWLFKKLIVR